MAGKQYTSHLIEVICPVCGKTFFPYPGHVYRDKRTPHDRVCSWGCVVKTERLYEEAKAAREEKRTAKKEKKEGGKA